ncbi:uncharacterized protein LOC128556964 [Mercenaria mercenaria]|uniref:uncharacterized protein LOC128556964 n=1 Tax=Mercenaria mercenaria TaxID=6596 RepID=UPI00234ED287|nr:uncharacterized protein LOC128556964 [Mercenaria mercenaria]
MSDSESEVVFSHTVRQNMANINSTPQDDDIRHVRVIDQIDNSDSEAGGDRANKSRSPTPRQRLNYLGIPTNTNSYVNSPVHNRQVPESNTISMKPDIYTGEGDWEVFETQFEVCAKLGNWNQRTKALVLAGSLRGKALEYYTHLATEIRERYDLLVTRLEQRFGGGNQRSKWLSLLEARSRLPGESASQFADDVQQMIRKAYPHLDPTAQELMTLHTIYRGLSQDLKYKCIVENCKTVVHAVEIIETYEGIFGTGPDRKRVRMTQGQGSDYTVDQDVRMTLKQILDRIDQLERAKHMQPWRIRQDARPKLNQVRTGDAIFVTLLVILGKIVLGYTILHQLTGTRKTQDHLLSRPGVDGH